MGDEKIIAREVPPEQVDFNFYFDSDCFSRRAGDINYEIYIPPQGNSRGYNSKEYSEIVSQVDSVMNDFFAIDEKHPFAHKTYKAAMIDNGIPYSPSKCVTLKRPNFA